MDNNAYFHERMIKEKLADLRAEGMRSQMLAQAGLLNHRKFRLPQLLRSLQRMLEWVTRFSLRRVEQPGIYKKVAQ